MTLSHIMEELKDVPEEKLGEIYNLIHSYTKQTKSQESIKEKILSFSGSFGDLDKEEFQDFLSNLKDTRKTMIEREVSL